jgi:hypothetical protein
VARANLHGIHGIFPSPEVLHHRGGKDSILEKKLAKGDAQWKPTEVLLGIQMTGGVGPGRQVSIPQDKHLKYRSNITTALATPRGVISFTDFRKIHGQVQYVSSVIPCMRFLMTPLNQHLSQPDHPVGLGRDSRLCKVLKKMVHIMGLAQARPAHITVVVPPSLPHYHGRLDAAAVGARGVWLPGTNFIWPTVWHLKWPPNIEQAIQDGVLSMADCESAAYFVQECILDNLLDGKVAGVSTHNFSDNTPTVGRITRHISGGESPFTKEMLHCLGICQLVTRRGLADCAHWPGKENLMGNIPLCSFKEGFPEGMVEQFLAHFTNQFPLPLPFSPNSQPGSWRLVTPPSGIVYAVILLL